MRIKELRGYRSDPYHSFARATFKAPAANTDIPYHSKGLQRQAQLDKFTEFMEINGFKALGQGYHGAVFEKPGYPWVFKVYKEDPAYANFVRWALSNQGNPNVPRFKGKPVSIAPDTYVVRMENLEPLRGSHRDLVRVLTRISDEWDTTADADMMKTDDARWLAKHHPGIYDIVRVAYRAWPHLVLDTHGDNVMLRGNTPVLTDPVSG